MKVVITPDGDVEMIEYKEAEGLIKSLGTIQERWRATHIVPTDHCLQLAFVILRRSFGEQGRIAQWTRSWRVQWTADLRPSGGPVVEPFDSRQEAIEFEIQWLEENISQALK